MAHYKPPTIREQGLQPYLDRLIDRHGGYGYSDFVTFVEKDVNIANLMRIFCVSRKTIERWIEVYEMELEDAESTSVR